METKTIVFTMGKAGSSTVMNSLRSVGINADRGYLGNVYYFGGNLVQFDKIVTIARDPIARNISDFFERNSDSTMVKKGDFDVLYAEFLKILWRETPLNFFDEFARYTDVNVYSRKFPKARKKYQIFDDRVLVLRTEDLWDKLRPALIDFFDLPKEAVVEVSHRADTAETRPYGAAYFEFVKQAKFDAEYLDLMYDNRYTKHFWTEKEIEGFREKWQK